MADAKTSWKSITSLVTGILSILLVWVPFLNVLLGLAGVIFGIFGLKDANKGDNGKGMAIAGIITGGIALVIAIIGLIMILITGAAIMSGMSALGSV